MGSSADWVSRNRAGKVVLKVPKGTQTLAPARVPDEEEICVAAVSNEGRLLIFELDELPVMTRGKGNKILSIPTKRASAGEEWMAGVVALGPKEPLRIFCGERTMTLKAKDREKYMGQRGRRGALLPSADEYYAQYGLTTERLKLASPNAIVMHPGPTNRGVEIAPEVADGPYSIILDQVTNGVAVRMALLYLLAGGTRNADTD